MAGVNDERLRRFSIPSKLEKGVRRGDEPPGTSFECFHRILRNKFDQAFRKIFDRRIHILVLCYPFCWSVFVLPDISSSQEGRLQAPIQA